MANRVASGIALGGQHIEQQGSRVAVFAALVSARFAFMVR